MARRAALWGSAAAGVVVALTLTATPSQAQDVAARSATCKPALEVLETIPGTVGPYVDSGVVADLGPHRLAVGSSRSMPVYWTGTTLHQVPLPDGYTSGAVTGVNRHSLMVGYLRNGSASRAFSYQVGDDAVSLLPGSDSDTATAVNDHGHIVGVRTLFAGTDHVRETGVEWANGQERRELPLPADSTDHSIDYDGSVSSITGINNAGQIVGNVTGAHGDVDDAWDVAEAVTWPAAQQAAPTVLGYAYADEENIVAGAIDDTGFVVGTYYSYHGGEFGPVMWSPYGGQQSGALVGGHDDGNFTAVSPTSGMIAGTASSGTFDMGRPVDQAMVWPGTGPALALRRLAPHEASRATAAADDGRVGGVARDTSGIGRPVIWTCALQQGRAHDPAAAPAAPPAAVPGIRR